MKPVWCLFWMKECRQLTTVSTYVGEGLSFTLQLITSVHNYLVSAETLHHHGL